MLQQHVFNAGLLRGQRHVRNPPRRKSVADRMLLLAQHRLDLRHSERKNQGSRDWF